MYYKCASVMVTTAGVSSLIGLVADGGAELRSLGGRPLFLTDGWGHTAVETSARHYSDAYPLPLSSQVVDRLSCLATKDPAAADSPVSLRAASPCYRPVCPQPSVRKRGRPPRLRSSAPPSAASPSRLPTPTQCTKL